MKHSITFKKQLSEAVYMIKVRAPLIAEGRKAGQFVMVMIDEDFGERIPLTIADADVAEGTITLIFQIVGQTTQEMSKLNVGDALAVVVGPLGTPTHIEKFGKVVCVGGGIGIAPLHPIAQALAKAGNEVTTIIGARDKSLIILEEEMQSIANNFIVCTDDGSAGRKGLVTEPLEEICKQDKPDMVIAIGPPIMMKFCALTTKPYNVKTLVSLNSIMVDGTGMCGGCRVDIGDQVKFVCVDGPEFDGHLVNWDNMIARLNAFKPCESNCRMHKAADKKAEEYK